MKTLTAPFVLFLNIIEFLDRLFHPKRRPEPLLVLPAENPSEIFEEGGKEIIRDLTENTPPAEPPRREAQILAPNGICLNKCVGFRSRAGNLLSAKVVGYSFEDPTVLLLSRNGGPLFRRRLC